MYGPIAPFVLSVAGEKRTFPALGKREYLACYDGANWEVRRRGGDMGVKSKGRIEPFRPVSGHAPVTLSCEKPESAYAWIEIAKHYLDR